MPFPGHQQDPSDAPVAEPADLPSAPHPSVAAVDLARQAESFAELLGRPVSAQQASGYYYTLREICQQPDTWRRTVHRMLRQGDILRQFISPELTASAKATAVRRSFTGRRKVEPTHEGLVGEPRQPIVVTGSGSSFYGADCLSWFLQEALSRPVAAVSGGQLLTDGLRHFPVERPSLMISLGRSGNSPESCAAIDLLLEREPACRHLIITCNRHGRLAQQYPNEPRVQAVLLDDETCDRSVAMTSSLTNMLVAGRFLGFLDAPSAYPPRISNLAAAATRVLVQYADALARVARLGFRSAVFLGSGRLYGVARESALKTLEMTAGQIPTFAETYLALRHGPMSAVRESTVVVCFLSSDPVTRAYETDLIREINQKQLARLNVIVGQHIDADIVLEEDLAIEVSDDETISGDDLSVLGILVGQLLAFFCSLHMGVAPDRPSTNGAIARVVPAFDIHQQ